MPHVASCVEKNAVNSQQQGKLPLRLVLRDGQPLVDMFGAVGMQVKPGERVVRSSLLLIER
jgi:hypothetical protein